MDLPGNPALTESVDNLKSKGYDAFAAPCNVADAQDVSSSFRTIIQQLNGLDFLVNNAGTPGTPAPIAPDDFESQGEAFWNKLLSVNLQGPARCTAAEYARALGPDVRVNAIAPGIVDSPWECRFDIPEATLQKLPLQRRGVPADFAEAIVYLLAGASYITGHTLVLDGGLLSGPKV